MMRFATAALLLLCAFPSLLEAQTHPAAPRDSTTELFLGVSPAEVTVGDRFQAVVRVDGPDGATVQYPDITGGDTIQSLDPVRITTTAAGDTVAVYTLVAWVAGQPLAATIPVQLRVGTEVRELSVSLRLPTVVSVLPAGDSIVEPRPAKALIVPSLFGERSWFWIYLVLGALIAGAFGYWLLDRRRGEIEEPGDPRDWALAQFALLDGTPMATLHDRQERFHRISRILRLYIARVDASDGLDLTTSEVTAALNDRLSPDSSTALTGLLEQADRVKFGGARPTELEAELLLDDARAFVGIYPQTTGIEPAARRAA